MNYCMVARLGGQSGSAVLFPSAGGAGLGTLASLGGDGMLVFLVEFFCHSIFNDKEFDEFGARYNSSDQMQVQAEDKVSHKNKADGIGKQKEAPHTRIIPTPGRTRRITIVLKRSNHKEANY